jgi:hypothetical protein
LYRLLNCAEILWNNPDFGFPLLFSLSSTTRKEGVTKRVIRVLKPRPQQMLIPKT